MNAILSLTKLGKKYNDFWAVSDLNMRVKQGDIYGFLGKNGAGKTTTIRMIMNLIKPTEGEIDLFGRTLVELGSELYKRTAATIEYPGFYLNLTARENLLYHAKMRDISEKKVDEELIFFGLHEAKDRLTKAFSLGMKQRLSLARAMLHEPEFLILDEPTNGLDPAGIHEIRETIKKLNSEKGITILFSSHILSEVELISKTVGIINSGQLIDEFSLQSFKDDSNSFIEVKVSNSSKAVDILYDKLHLPNASIVDASTIHLFGFNQPHLVNRTLIENGLEVERLLTHSETLEKRFMRLTGGNYGV